MKKEYIHHMQVESTPFKDLIRTITNPNLTVTQHWDALSTFFHHMLERNMCESLDDMAILDPSLACMPNSELKSVIATLVEYTYLECHKPIPAWVFDDMFIFKGTPYDWFSIKLTQSILPSACSSLVDISIQQQTQLFKKRNIPNHGFYNAV